MTKYPGEKTISLGPGPTINALIEQKKSMLSGRLPVAYGLIETREEVEEIAFQPNSDERIVRLHIVWDNPVGSLELQDVLDRMRETGAAMVVKAERVT